MRNRLILLLATLGMLFAFTVSSSAANTASQTVKDGVDRITPKTLKALLDKKNEVIVADVRSLTAFKKQHITGAISVPLNLVESSPDKLPLDKKIVFY